MFKKPFFLVIFLFASSIFSQNLQSKKQDYLISFNFSYNNSKNRVSYIIPISERKIIFNSSFSTYIHKYILVGARIEYESFSS